MFFPLYYLWNKQEGANRNRYFVQNKINLNNIIRKKNSDAEIKNKNDFVKAFIYSFQT